MLSIFRKVIPYLVIAALCALCLKLNARVAEVETNSAYLKEMLAVYTEAANRSDNILTEWAEERRIADERKQFLQDGLESDNAWGAAVLPSDYLRVLREAGIAAPGTDSSADNTASGSPYTKDEGNH